MIKSPTYQKIHPVGLLSLMVRNHSNGCLKINNELASWYFYFEQKKLVFATHSVSPIERLQRHLRIFEDDIPSLDMTSPLIQTLFRKLAESSSITADYQGICWLVSQNYIEAQHAHQLIRHLIKEVLDSFLMLREGEYKLIQSSRLNNLPKFCHLDIRNVLDMCHQEPRYFQKRRSLSNPHYDISLTSSKLGDLQSSRSEQTNFPANIHSPLKSIPKNTPGKSTKKYLIACIDDSPSMLRKIESCLDDESFSVITINSSLSAFLEVIRNKPDLILLDVTMPHLDGYELCYLIRRHSKFKETPIIMLTGKTGLLDRTKAKLIGASSYLTKPFTKTDLVQEIRSHLG
ncbi:MAG: response regulator [Leptolyngbyaceae bacterium]|nr:response regulator [Leptolyngbyaceae bacterium]